MSDVEVRLPNVMREHGENIVDDSSLTIKKLNIRGQKKYRTRKGFVKGIYEETEGRKEKKQNKNSFSHNVNDSTDDYATNPITGSPTGIMRGTDQENIKTSPALNIGQAQADTQYISSGQHEELSQIETQASEVPVLSIDSSIYHFLVKSQLDNIRTYMRHNLHDTHQELHAGDPFGRQPLGTEEAFLLLKYIAKFNKKNSTYTYRVTPADTAKIFELFAKELGYTDIAISEETITDTQTNAIRKVPVLKWKIPTGNSEREMSLDFTALSSELADDSYDYDTFMMDTLYKRNTASNTETLSPISPAMPAELTPRTPNVIREIQHTQVVNEIPDVPIISEKKKTSSLLLGIGNAIAERAKRITGKLSNIDQKSRSQPLDNTSSPDAFWGINAVSRSPTTELPENTKTEKEHVRKGIA